MKVETLQFIDGMPSELVKEKTVVVIDVFRATSMIITALANGMQKVIVSKTVDEAVNQSKKFKNTNVLLAGERKREKIPGFDLDNSPTALLNQEIKAKNLILTTTNGTKAIEYASEAKKVYIGAFLNAQALTNSLLEEKNDVVLLCSGSSNHFAAEDALCAGWIARLLSVNADVEFDDFSMLLKTSCPEKKISLIRLLSCTSGFKQLMGKGLKQDIAHCLNHHAYCIVPELAHPNVLSAINAKTTGENLCLLS